MKGITSHKISLKNREGNRTLLTMDFTGFPYLAIWSKPNAPFICIEPWYGIDDFTTHNGKLKEKRGICCIDPQKLFTYTYAVTFGE